MEKSVEVCNTSVYAMCRLCLSQGRDLILIFEQQEVDSITLVHRIRDCVKVDVCDVEGLPKRICRDCLLKVNDWHEFKRVCTESDNILRQHLQQQSDLSEDNVKIEEVSNIYIKSEDQYALFEDDNDDNTHEAVSDNDSDNTPLSIVRQSAKQKRKRNKTRVVKNKNKNNLSRGRAPKAKPLCLICNQKFGRFTELINHQNTVHNVKLEGMESLGEEVGDMEHLPRVVVYRCHVCSKEYEGRDELRAHCKVVHNTKVIQPYLCGHCDRQFPSWGLLVIHERKHTGDKPYSCDVCGKQNFISQTSLRRHKLIHLKVYSCRDCGRDFNCDSALKAHIRCKHTNERPYLCNICGRSFSLSAILVAHMTSHSTERKYVCDVCGFASKTSGNHYRHKNTHKTGLVKSFHCETCGKAFDSKLKLSSHQIIHRPVRPHVCKSCGKAFLYNNKLERHILLVHARERPFPCSLCGKKLASKFGLGIHLKTHNRNEAGGHVADARLIVGPHGGDAKMEPLEASIVGVIPSTEYQHVGLQALLPP